MEELQRHRGSKKGYHALRTKLIGSANKLMTTDIESSHEETAKTVTALDSLLGELNRKEALLADLDAKILLLVKGEDELEAEVFKAEEIQSKLTKIVRNIKSFTTHSLQRGDKSAAV